MMKTKVNHSHSNVVFLFWCMHSLSAMEINECEKKLHRKLEMSNDLSLFMWTNKKKIWHSYAISLINNESQKNAQWHNDVESIKHSKKNVFSYALRIRCKKMHVISNNNISTVKTRNLFNLFTAIVPQISNHCLNSSMLISLLFTVFDCEIDLFLSSVPGLKPPCAPIVYGENCIVHGRGCAVGPYQRFIIRSFNKHSYTNN